MLIECTFPHDRLSERYEHTIDELARMLLDPHDTQPEYWAVLITITNNGRTVRIQTLEDPHDDE